MKGRILTKALLAKFREHLILEERSDATIEKYCRDVCTFTTYAGGAEITKENWLKSAEGIDAVLGEIIAQHSCLGAGGAFVHSAHQNVHVGTVQHGAHCQRRDKQPLQESPDSAKITFSVHDYLRLTPVGDGIYVMRSAQADQQSHFLR